MLVSQNNIDYNFSQEDMAPRKRQRYNNPKYFRKYNVYPRARSVPRAIQTRGTPEGYYEIPTSTLMRLYCNSSTGMWNTDQNTGGALGATGYQGFSSYVTPAAGIICLGNGSIVPTISAAFGQYGQLSNVFDLVKMCEVTWEFWITNQQSSLNTAFYGSPELWIAQDVNDATPPADAVSLQDYSNCKRVILDQKAYSVTLKPHINYMVSDAVTDSSSSNIQNAGTVPATYIRAVQTDVPHFGLKGWLYLPSANASTATYEINIRISVKRRFKMNK